MRALIMRDVEEMMKAVGLYVGGNDGTTNLTGHPTVALPNGFRRQNDVEAPNKHP